MAEKKNRRVKQLSKPELSAFCSQMAMVMKSGISVQEGVSIMTQDAENPYTKEILSGVSERCETGSSFYAALSESGVFPKYMLDMIAIGEESGRLDEVLDSLADYYEREDGIAKSIRHAVSYPLVMIVMMLLVIGVLVIKVLPIFNQVFQQLGSELTGFSKTVMDMGAAVSRYAVVFVLILGVLALAFIIFRNTRGGRRALDVFKAHFFVTKKLSAKIAAGRFASGMALMMASGLDTDQSLEMVSRLVDHPVVEKKVRACQQAIAEGASFADAVMQAGIFSGLYARMLAVGFKTGSTDQVMKKLADKYEQEVDETLSSIISVLEPSLVAVLSIIVGMILLSVMLPLMGIMSTIG
ncbi:MAG: type II secretion system F family protein [Oscillospiraceae bacterium]|nr:type II secretion system F family protein [Oscillospiraceae bacterium]